MPKPTHFTGFTQVLFAELVFWASSGEPDTVS